MRSSISSISKVRRPPLYRGWVATAPSRSAARSGSSRSIAFPRRASVTSTREPPRVACWICSMSLPSPGFTPYPTEHPRVHIVNDLAEDGLVLALGDEAEGFLKELRCTSRVASGDTTGVLDRAIERHSSKDVAGLGQRALVTRAAQPTQKAGALLLAQRTHQVDQHERPLALQQIAECLLAVEIFLAHQVQQVVLYLERDAHFLEHLANQVELARSRVAGGDRTQPARRSARIPARLLGHHVDVVAVPRGHDPLPDPAELDRLALERLSAHADDLIDQGKRPGKARPVDVLQHGVHREKVQRIAGVHRQRDPMLRVQASLAATIDRLVFDIVVNQEGVVEHLHGRRDLHRVFTVPSESTARGDTECRTQSLAAASGVLAHQPIQAVDRTTIGDEAKNFIGHSTAAN